MPAGTLDDRYLNWLYGQIATAELREGSRTYWKLLRQMYCTEFTYFVPNDESRAADGKELRRQWMHEHNLELDDDWLDLPCSFLEMLLGLANRMTFQAEQSPEYWFWDLLRNLGFHKFYDGPNYRDMFIDYRIRVVNERSYDAKGNGGIFPLRETTNDQTRVELWYQMCEYIVQDM